MRSIGRLREKSAAVAERWLADALATYAKDASAAFGRQQDPFANPVGHAMREGVRAVVEGLVEGRDPAELCASLDEIIKIRAIQEFSPSQAVGFVFLLKEVLRAELGGEDPGAESSTESADLEKQIDRVALGAFDIYTRYRAQVYELRVNEITRGVAAIVRGTQRCGPSPDSDEDGVKPGTSVCAEVQRGGGR